MRKTGLYFIGFSMILSSPSLSLHSKSLHSNLLSFDANQDSALRLTQSKVLETRNISGVSGQPIPLVINLPLELEFPVKSNEASGQIIIRGLPEAVNLSAGEKSRDLWRLDLNAVSKLTIEAKPGYFGQFNIEVFFVLKDNTIFGQKNLKVDIRSASESKLSNSVTADTKPLPSQKTASPQEKKLIDAGKKLLNQGQIAAARLIFEELANSNSIEGTFLLAETYDPILNKESPLSGVKPDLEKALFWYEKAHKLGNPTANQRLVKLGRTP